MLAVRSSSAIIPVPLVRYHMALPPVATANISAPSRNVERVLASQDAPDVATGGKVVATGGGTRRMGRVGGGDVASGVERWSAVVAEVDLGAPPMVVGAAVSKLGAVVVG